MTLISRADEFSEAMRVEIMERRHDKELESEVL